MFLHNPNYDRRRAGDRTYFEREVLEPTPVEPLVYNFGSAMEDFLDARKALKQAKKDVPGYTGQWDDKDYYAQEQEDYNRALERLYKAIKD